MRLSQTIKLALPVAVSQMGYMTMLMVDSFMVGRLGAEALGGVGLGSAIFFALTALFMGTLFGLDFLVSHAFGSKDLEECHYWLVQGAYLALVLSIPLVGGIYLAAQNLSQLKIDPGVEVAAQTFLRTVSWSSPCFLLFIAFRQYLQAMNSVKATTLIVVIANVVNLFLNWALVFGNLGFPELKVAGSALSTSLTRVMMFLMVVGFTLYRDKKGNFGLLQARLTLHLAGMRKLFRLGFPAGMQLLFEVAIFSLSATLAGKLGAIPLAAHTIVLNVASFTYMVPLGISAAAAVQVGQALGSGHLDEARAYGWSSLLLGAMIMLAFGVVMLVAGGAIMAFFTPDLAVIEIGKQIFLLAALFQIADGVQTVGTGALRGLSNTRFSMGANLAGHWAVGFPVGWYLCFSAGYGILGLWSGLTLGLWTTASLVLARWAFPGSRFPPH